MKRGTIRKAAVAFACGATAFSAAAGTPVDPKWPALLEQRRQWWSFQPVRLPQVPPVESEAWPTHAIDRFLLARMEREGLKPSAAAEKQTLLRRASFVLTGLPPSPEELDRFMHDPKPSAFERAVDRLLASPHFGERWAQHWMDLARFSDTHGSEHDPLIPHAWRYRDYLVRAFNDDVPYDRFVREQIAGDLLAPRWNRALGINEAPIGTAFFRFVEFYPTPTDPKAEEGSVIESEVDAFGKTFQGLTLACARCHDHKFDPVSATDYYALYGIFASARATMHRLDDPAMLHRHDATLAAIKARLRVALAAAWLRDLEQWPEALAALKSKAGPDALAAESCRRWKFALEAAEKDKAHLLRPLADSLAGRPTGASSGGDKPGHRVFVDFSKGGADWYACGGSLEKISSRGDFTLSNSPAKIVDAIYPRGRFSHLVSDKQGGTLRSPNFRLDMKFISALVCGTNEARLRLIVENFHGDQVLYTAVMPKLKDSRLRWMTLNVRKEWAGLRGYLELIPRDEMVYPGKMADAAKINTDGRSGAGISRVVFHDESGAPAMKPVIQPAGDWTQVIAQVTQASKTAIANWRDGACDDAQALWLDALVGSGVLPNTAEGSGADISSLVSGYRKLEDQIPVPVRVPGLADEDSFDESLFLRGNYKTAGDPVSKRYLEVLGSAPYTKSGTGRLQLADEITSPRNPLTARVMVNRLWHHVFGAGLVPSVDNFGLLGERPSHPELLDWLASEFVAQQWSVKRMLRLMVTSSAFQVSSDASPRARERDPGNRLLSHATVRRLDGEAIRDSLLRASGRMDAAMSGPGVPLPLPEAYNVFESHVSGPLDGNGRRSIYLEARRGYPNGFLMAFDQPRPIVTTGRRNITTVPAQSLALMNDPLVLDLAARLAKQLLGSTNAPSAQLIEQLYQMTLGRHPATGETRRALEFLQTQAGQLGLPPDASHQEPRLWRDLAHGVFNMKEFIYLK